MKKLILLLLLSPLAGLAQVKYFLAKYQAVATYDTISVLFRDANSLSLSGYNEVNFSSTAGGSNGSLVYKNGTASGASVSVGTIGGVSSQGSCSGGTTGFPDAAGNRVMFRTGNTITVTYSGLDNSKTYDLVHWAARASNSTTSTVTSQTKTASISSVNNNCSTTAKLTGLVPSGGQIVVVISGSGSTTNAYANAHFLIRNN